MAEESQALAGLRVMVAVARADGRLAEEERRQIAEALRELAPNVSQDAILAEDIDLDAEIAKIVDPEVRTATYRAAFLLSVADGEHHPEEGKILAKLRAAFGVTDEGTGVEKLLGDEVPLDPVELDEETRTKEAKKEILGQSMIAGALGANPIPILSIATELAVFYIQGRLVRNLCWYYGFDVTLKHVGAMMATSFGVGVARVGIMQLVKFVPVWGSVVGAATAFTTTYAIGEAIRRHFAAGGDFASLAKKEAKKAYEDIKAGAAKQAYEENKSKIDETAKNKSADLEALARDVKEGKAGDPDVEARLKGLE